MALKRANLKNLKKGKIKAPRPRSKQILNIYPIGTALAPCIAGCCVVDGPFPRTLFIGCRVIISFSVRAVKLNSRFICIPLNFVL